MAIDIGPGATNRGATFAAGSTYIAVDNPANATGTIDTLEFWFSFADGEGVIAGTFFGSSTEYTSRDSEAIGTVTQGSKQTFSGLDCDVESGDFAGIYFSPGVLERDSSGFAGVYLLAGDQFGAGEQTYTLAIDDAISIFGTGTEAAAGQLMGAIAGHGGLAGPGGIAGRRGGIAG